MGCITSTRLPSLVRASLGPLLLLVATLGGCLFWNLEDLPCRRDCHCPEDQLCQNKKCVPKDQATRGGEGQQDGPCGANDLCNDATLTCHVDSCGGKACRKLCNPSGGSGQCPEGQICEAISGPPDAGFFPDGGGSVVMTTEGVCSP
ncbi:MAG: hypothetical protein AB2A00_42600 [Myxococcota bacterium]